jgi:hypothetical protein
VLNPWRSQEELGGRFLGHRVHLKAKAGGEKSMPEKRESPEGVYEKHTHIVLAYYPRK